MNKNICYITSEIDNSIITIINKITGIPIDKIKNIIIFLDEEYDITSYKIETLDIEYLFNIKDVKNTINIEYTPKFSILRNKRKNNIFPPPQKGKINSKPKGKYRH